MAYNRYIYSTPIFQHRDTVESMSDPFQVAKLTSLCDVSYYQAQQLFFELSALIRPDISIVKFHDHLTLFLLTERHFSTPHTYLRLIVAAR